MSSGQRRTWAVPSSEMVPSRATQLFPRLMRKPYRVARVLFRLALPRYKVTFIQPYWGRTEFLCGLRPDSDVRSGHCVEVLTEKLRQKLNITGAVIPTSSGRTALELALRALKKRHSTRQEVILPTYGCRGTFDPVINAGLIPALADIDKNLNVSVDSVKGLLREDTLAILVPHLCGCKARIREIASVAHANGVFVIEDVCQALGGKDDGVFLGTCGDMSVFSFGMGKNLMATAGGALVSHVFAEEVRQEAQMLGKEETSLVKRRFKWTVFKYFFRPVVNIDRYKSSAYTYSEMHPLDAQLVCAQLDRLEGILEGRRKNARKVIEALRTAGLKCVLQNEEDHIYTKLSVICECPEDYCKLRNALHRRRIETEGMYTPLHLQACAAKSSTKEGWPHSEEIYGNVFNIPVRPNLTERQLNRILTAIGSIAGA
jgi:dTDP-4-amino-4,6-dideoxygalactose transaminase